MSWDWLSDFLNEALAWLVEVLLWVPQKLYALILAALSAIINAIPVPAWADALSLNWVPASMAYFLEPFQIGFAITVITGAYFWRFLIRRTPVVG